MIKKVVSFQLSIVSILFLLTTCFAKEITILCTGSTHAMLYPCSCPKEPDGGVSRRASLLKELRKDNPYTLVLDSGSFFAGGLMDEYTQNTQLDKQRTMVNLKALELMQYDALNITDNEFNFGREFLEEVMAKSNLTFLSSNIESEKILPYIIKEVAGIKVGIIGVTGLSSKEKLGGLKFIEPSKAVKQAVEKLKQEAASLIILLGSLNENEYLSLIEEIKGIDILITTHRPDKKESVSKIGSTIVLRPAWQGRRLGKLSLTIKDNKIIDYKAEELRLSDKIPDDPDINAILPRCFSDMNCKKKGLIGICQDAGTINAACLFSEPLKVNLSVIVPKDCSLCETKTVINYLNTLFPGLVVSYLYYPGRQADKLIKDFGIKGLPAYLLGKEIEKEKGFLSLRPNLQTKSNLYLLRPEVFGFSYFLNRKRIEGKLDLFISLYDKGTPALLEIVKEFNPALHFLAMKQQNSFDAKSGNPEVEEYLRSVCVKNYYPQKFWDYIICRSKSIDSSWWETCLENLDTAKIKTCAQDKEGEALLEENISLNKELEIMFGPTYLLNNLEVFATKGTPNKEDLKKIIKR